MPVDGSSCVFRHVVQMFRQLYARQAQLSLQATSYSEIVLLPSEATSSSMLRAVGMLQLIPTDYWGVASWTIYLGVEAQPAPSFLSLLAPGSCFGCSVCFGSDLRPSFKQNILTL